MAAEKAAPQGATIGVGGYDPSGAGMQSIGATGGRPSFVRLLLDNEDKPEEGFQLTSAVLDANNQLYGEVLLHDNTTNGTDPFKTIRDYGITGGANLLVRVLDEVGGEWGSVFTFPGHPITFASVASTANLMMVMPIIVTRTATLTGLRYRTEGELVHGVPAGEDVRERIGRARRGCRFSAGFTKSSCPD